MEFFTGKKANTFEDYLKIQKTTELEVLRDIKDTFEKTGENEEFLVKTIRHFGSFPIHEDYTLQRMVLESRQDAELYGESEPELFEKFALLTAAEAIASLKLALTDPHQSTEQKTLLKEAAQLQIYSVSGVLSDTQYDSLLEYLETFSGNIAGIDFTDPASIEAALASVES